MKNSSVNLKKSYGLNTDDDISVYAIINDEVRGYIYVYDILSVSEGDGDVGDGISGNGAENLRIYDKNGELLID